MSTKEDIIPMLKRIGIPYAYDHFAEGESPKPPFMVYLYPKANNFAADGVAYHKKDTRLEEKVEETMNMFGFFYLKSETWIPSEKMYEVLYQTEV